MRKRLSYKSVIALLLLLFSLSGKNTAGNGNTVIYSFRTTGTFMSSFAQPDSVDLRYPFSETGNYPFSNSGLESPLYLRPPSNVNRVIEYDPVTRQYYFTELVGSFNYRPPQAMSFKEFQEYQHRESKKEYWRLKSKGESLQTMPGFLPQLNLGVEAFDRVFGTSAINITPSGSAELIFGFSMNKIDNPTISERLRKTPSFNFEEKILMNVTGSIGDKMKLDVNYNTEATFEFENRTKLEYAGKEDEIIKKIEAGNVTLPLSGSLITGSQSLFGLKTEMQFGKLTVTNVFSQQKGETSVIEVQGGAQLTDYSITADNYDANRHFFISEYFRENYNKALQNLPVINSGITINRIEVWITNKSSNFEESRNIVAFTDIGEANPYSALFTRDPSETGTHPRNELNDLYSIMSTGAYSGVRSINEVTNIFQPLEPGFTMGRDYEKIENARKLTTREFTFNDKLGYISLNSALNADEILAVAYEYTYNGKTYRVGEMSSSAGISAPDALYLKLIKGTNLTPVSPAWKLMMKNIYAIGAYQVNPQDFTLEVLYQDDKTGNAVNYIPEGDLNKKILLKLLNLDNLNSNNDPYPDGQFDFISGITITPSSGRVIFPVLEPFGQDMENIIIEYIGNDPSIINRYVFRELYDSTKTKAQQIAEKNKFKLAGSYKSASGSEIMLNAMNVPQGSVKVTAGGRELSENIDYTVDYALGRVTIINQGLLESGTPVRISLESNTLFNIQTKTLVGTHLDYKISDNFNIGGTILNLTERPLTQKVNIGDEPISNTMWGINTSYKTESQWLTNVIDKIPLLDTKEPSSLTFMGEFAQLVPGHSRAIEKKGNAYIDDFEGSETTIDLKQFSAWSLSSAPTDNFPEAKLSNNLIYGFNRAKLAWYYIDPLFLRNTIYTPPHLKENPDQQSSHFVREVFEKDIFPKKETPSGIPTNISVLNLAFYPRERGPYNYDFERINPDGSLQEPKNRWGGVMREVVSSDFEAANIEFIEFWLMDPFVEEENHAGGDLYFNLGNISEDVLKDGRKSFENGLPSSAEVTLVDTTAWGRVPRVQSLVPAFNYEPSSREYQDVGLDGLSDTDERTFFSDFLETMKNVLSPEAYTQLEADPSSDNFHYYRGSDYDRDKLGILERYKNYNGPERNSRTAEQSTESYPTTGTTLPNTEDINRDNTLNENESFFSYRISMRSEDLEIGRNFVVDKVRNETTFINGSKSVVHWYQFRVPISGYEKTVGSIQDFKSIRFIRMYLSNFEDSVILRFAKLHLVRGEWRKYNFDLTEGGESWTGQEPSQGKFDISAVNIEENAGKEPVNYVLPPGITRVIDPAQPQLRQLNEQSIVLKVRDLEDGDARAAYKNLNLDIRQYRKIELEAHAEAIPGILLHDNELTAFVRLGSDYKGNFYEYEVPLKVTPPGRYDGNDDGDRRIVWPEENRFVIELEIFQRAKQARNDAMRQPDSNVDISTVYFIYDDLGNKVSISGNPNLSNIRTIMIGVRNPKAGKNRHPDDGMPKSGEIWLNELRLTDFNQDGGWAANARLTTRLADFGTLTFAGNTSTPGFGSIEKKVQERSKEQILQYDLSSSFELGKFFPEKAGISIPVYTGYSESIINPQYNPLDPDIPLKAALENAATAFERDSIKRIAQDYTRRTSLNFTNVGLRKKQGQPRIYDLANWSVSYSYNEVFSRNISTDFYEQRRYRGGLNYNFNTRPKNVAPLSKIKWLSNPYLRLIRDFNFYYLPSRLSFRTDMNRMYMERKLRNLNNPYLEIEPTFNKDFYWNRYYDMTFDLTRSLKFDFSATNIARIDEPEGRMKKGQDDYEAKRDSILLEISRFGRTTSYNHQFNLNYSLPLNKIPLLSWLNVTTRYTGTYGWDAGPILSDPGIDLGNILKNSNTTQVNAQINLITIYNKVPYLKELEQKARARNAGTAPPRTRTVNYSRPNQFLRPNIARFYTHKLKTENIKVVITTEEGDQIEADVEVISENRVKIMVSEEVRRANVEIIGTRDIGAHPADIIIETSMKILTGVKNINISYSISEGTVLPGYKPRTNILGMQNYGGLQAPGLAFIAGWQDKNFARDAFNKGWLSKDSLINAPYMMNSMDRFNLRATLEPLRGLRIDLTANRNYAENLSEFYIADRFGNLPVETERGKRISGNFSMSYLSWGSAFERIYTKDLDFTSYAFGQLKDEYRKVISKRLAAEYEKETGIQLPDSAGYYEGFGPNSQQVLISSFLAAYGSKDPDKVTLKTFPSIWDMMPNWRVSYDGLSRVEFFKKFVTSITLNHAYRSSYNIGQYISNPTEDIGFMDNQYNFIPLFDASSVSISEQFSPLFDLNTNWKNSLSTRIEFNRSRTLSLSTANNQVNEMSSKEIVIGTGYRFKEVQLIINQREYKSDLNARADLSVRDNRTVIRKLAEDSDQITAGQRIITIKTTFDYVLSDRFNLRFFFDQRINKPFISLSYPTSNTNIGFSVRFTLVQ